MPADDRYTIAGSGGVLKNKLGLTTQERVDAAMNEVATTRWAILASEPIPDRLDLDYLRSIHRRLLGPVLEWAGELRQAGDEVVAGDTGIVYARSRYFRQGLDEVFGQLASEDYLRGLSADEFAERLADRWGYLSMTHPFRDGNTRSQSAYVDRLAIRAGHPIDWHRVDVDTLRNLRLHAVASSERPLANYLRDHLAPQHAPTALSFERTAESQQMRALIETQRRALGQDPAGILRPPSGDRGARRRRPPESRGSDRGVRL